MDLLPPEQVVQKLQELTQGLWYLSESDYPVEVVQFEVPFTNELTTDQVLTLVHQPPGEPVEISDLHYFFRNVTKFANPEEGLNSMANRFLTLEAFLGQHLQNVKVYRIGESEIQTYVLGRLNDDTYMGVKTTVISPS